MSSHRRASKPDTADLRGLPVAYFLQQLADMKMASAVVPYRHATVNDMIPVAKAIRRTGREARRGILSLRAAVRGARVIETDTVPVTHPGPHNVQLVDATGTKEPIGMRIIEVPRTSIDDCCAMPRPGSSQRAKRKHQEGRDAGEDRRFRPHRSVRHVSWRGA